MECQIGPCANFVLLERACNSATIEDKYATIGDKYVNWNWLQMWKKDCPHWLTSSYSIKKLLKILLKNSHTQSLLPTTDQILPTPMAPSNTLVPAPDHLLNKKVSKACRIEGSKSSLFMFFLPLESLSYHTWLSRLCNKGNEMRWEETRGDEMRQVENDNLCLWTMN